MTADGSLRLTRLKDATLLAATGGAVAAAAFLAHRLLATADAVAAGTLAAADAAAQVRFTAAVLVVLTVWYVGVLALMGAHASQFTEAPLRDLVRRVRLIGNGAFEERVTPRGVRETRELAHAVNDMAASLASREQRLMHAERLTAVGTVVTGVAHEINNPLTFLRGNQELLLHETRDALARPDLPEDARASLEAALEMHEANLEGITRLSDIASALENIGRAPRKERRAQDVNRVVHGCLIIAHHKLKRGISLTKRLDARARVRCDPTEISQVVLNLVLNAADAMEGRGHLTVETRDEGEHVRVSVRDTGPGIPAAYRDRVFDPFVTTKADGTGLGLALSKRIVEAHGGTIGFETEDGNGTCFTLRFPATTDHV